MMMMIQLKNLHPSREFHEREVKIQEERTERILDKEYKFKEEHQFWFPYIGNFFLVK